MTSIDSNISSIVRLSDGEFHLISELVYKQFGIKLTEKKKALVRGRLNSLIKSMGLTSFKAYYDTVINDSTGGSLLSLIDRISTNHSYFFREAGHFDVLKKTLLPELLEELTAQGSKGLRIWSAGSASGEEAYTLAMVLSEYFGTESYKWDIGILGTDISISALGKAVKGIYHKNQAGRIPAAFKKYFRRIEPDNYAIDEKIKRMVLFKRLNLMREDYPFKGKFHIVFCRNVMIYFDRKTKKELVAKLCRYMHKGGYLFIGHSETLGREVSGFKYIQPTVYRKW
ncbi:MAG: chemotaxis protein CheR [Spirochaetes bacterium]|nr:chemotaxis protein CheR [Spirochaetota bacterium]